MSSYNDFTKYMLLFKTQREFIKIPCAHTNKLYLKHNIYKFNLHIPSKCQKHLVKTSV